jgi:hypothetical protein
MAAKIELHFLYQTRTIFRQPRSSLHLCTPRRCFGCQPKSHQSQGTIHPNRTSNQKPWLRLEKLKGNNPEQPYPASSTGSNINIGSTITPTERKAFEAILRLSKKQGGLETRSPFVDATDINVDHILELFSTSIKTQHDINQPITSPAESAPDKLGELQSTSRSWRPEENESVIREIVHRRMHEIVDALQEAAASTLQSGDIALWHSCEAQIFPLGEQLYQQPVYQPPKFLGPLKFTFTAKHSDVPVKILEQEQKRHQAIFEAKENDPTSTRLHMAPPTPETNIEGDQDHKPDSRQARAILHHLYPAALLYALRLFARNFPSSHFPFNLLPRIRELGHTSYVLGASTQFYNSLMSLKWHRNSSLREIHKLLSEMEQSGVEFDEETCRIIRHIAGEREASVTEAKGTANNHMNGRDAVWWGRHEQVLWYPRILDWLNVVTDQLSRQETSAPPTETSPQG